MYDKGLTLEVLMQIQAVLRTIAERFKPVKTVLDFTGSPGGMEKLDSICMLLIVVGETLKKLDKITDASLLAKYPQINWKQVKGLRDVISHQYFDVNAEAIFDVCQTKIGPLGDAIAKIIEDLK
jgi:uncharacterized protein with HEPN domain